MTVVDASVWVSVFAGTDRHHGASRRWLASHVDSGQPIIGPAHVLSEVAGAIARRTGQSELGEAAVRILLTVPGLLLVETDHRLAMDAAFVAARLRLRGADALYVAVADRLGVPLITWDCEQAERASGLVDAEPPSAI